MNKKILIIIILITLLIMAITTVASTKKANRISESTKNVIQITEEQAETLNKNNNVVQNDENSHLEEATRNITNSSSKKEVTESITPPVNPTTPAHIHSWIAVYKEVDKGYYDTVTKKESWTKCHICGADITHNIRAHMEAHMDDGITGSYGTSYRYYDEKVWVSNIVKEVDYYKCSCGTTK